MTAELRQTINTLLTEWPHNAFSECTFGERVHEALTAALRAETPSDGGVMVRVDPVYVEQMRGDGLVGPFARIRLVEPEGSEPHLELTTSDTKHRLRAALAALVGVDGREDLEQLEAVMRLTPAPAEDKAVTIDAIHALIATLPTPPRPGEPR